MAGRLAGGLYTQAYYIRIYTVYYIMHNPSKNLFKINALPKILEKTRLKSMLCLFLDAMPKMPFLVLGIGKSFKINNLRLIWRCCAHDSQNLGKGRGARRLYMQGVATNEQKIGYLQKVSAKIAKGSRESWAQLLLFIFYLYL